MIFQLRRSGRGVDGHRNAPGKQHAEEALQVLAAGWQHDGDRLTRHQALIHQPRRGSLGRLLELSEGDVQWYFAARLVEKHVGSVRLLFSAPGQDPLQRVDALGYGIRRPKNRRFQLEPL
jgi:hypothetical protein